MTGRTHGQELKEIESTLIQICKAIVSVLRVDITIVDTEYRRIVGTGRYSKSIGSILAGNGVYQRAMNIGTSQIVEDPRTNEICEPCVNKAHCEEFAQVCCPIMIEGETIGIMGLAAFDEGQKDLLLSNKEGMLGFIEIMAGLIGSKINENREVLHVRQMAGELESVVNSMDEGVITMDGDGQILRFNLIADEMLGITNQESVAAISSAKTNIVEISSLMGKLSIESVKKRGGHISNEEFSYRNKGNICRGFFNVKPIPFDNNITGYLVTLTRASEMLKVVNAIAGGRPKTAFEDILGNSEAITQAKNSAIRIAHSSSTVLIQGETGSGKELFARAIHDASTRNRGPFVAINCSAIPENLMESELFGYEEGAFTGARKAGRMGKFELAMNGTIFLDEIGDMPLNLQTKLLRVLQENTVERVGGNTLIPVDIRILAATNKDLEEMVAEREFRNDLYYRLNVIPLYLPALRERKDDISLMASCFLEKYNRKLGRKITSIAPEVNKVFMEYDWPGNVRELENTLEFAVNMCNENSIRMNDLPRRIKEAHSRAESTNPFRTLEAIEKEAIGAALKEFETPEKAAEVLDIGRATIYRKIKLYSLESSQNENKVSY